MRHNPTNSRRRHEAPSDTLTDARPRRSRSDSSVATSREPTFAAVAQDWFARQRNLRPTTGARYENDLRLHLLPRFGDRSIGGLDEDDIVSLIDDMLQAGYAATSIRNCLTPLRRIFRFAVRRGLAERNPVTMLERHEIPHLPRRDLRLLDSESIARLLAAATPRYRTLLATAIFTGLRQGEVLGLTWEEVDFERGFIRVRKSVDRSGQRVPPKTSAAVRDVVMMPALAELLAEHHACSRFNSPSDYVFASLRGTPLGHRNVAQRGFDAAAARAGFNRPGQRKMNFHDMRHLYASLLIGQGANVTFVSRQLGHANPAITLAIYAHLFNQYAHADRARSLLERDFRPVLEPLLLKTCRYGAEAQRAEVPPREDILKRARDHPPRP
jgi:integrase